MRGEKLPARVPDSAAFSRIYWPKPEFLPLLVTLLAAVLAVCCGTLVAAEPCTIEVVEKGSGWPVPLVELRTTHNVRFVTDNAGVIAFDLPELMGRRTWFDVRGDGYEVPKDGFGGQGVQLTPQPGKTLKVEVRRTIVARRLGRLTGAGLFAESQKVGREMAWRESGVFGSDSVLGTVHGNRIFWAWGDTTLPDYWLGIFDTSSATTSLFPLSSLEPPLRVTFNYFCDPSGRPRGVAKLPGSGPTWLSAYVSLPDKAGKPHLVATYAKIKPPLETYECGLCVWDEQKAEFQRQRVLWTRSDPPSQRRTAPGGHPAFWKDRHGKAWVLFGNPLPTLRCPANYEAWQDPSTWEMLKPQATLASVSGNERVRPHSGSIAWNEFRKRWVTVFMESYGKPSVFGEVWYAEAETPHRTVGQSRQSAQPPQLHVL